MSNNKTKKNIMNEQDKQLLLQDLCARLPHGVKVQNTLNGEIIDLETRMYCLPTALATNFKPYLRPLSTMTEEEKRFIDNIVGQTRDCCGIFRNYIWLSEAKDVTDFYCSHHLDHRGLIPMGLAIKAPEDMYNK